MKILNTVSPKIMRHSKSNKTKFHDYPSRFVGRRTLRLSCRNDLHDPSVKVQKYTHAYLHTNGQANSKSDRQASMLTYTHAHMQNLFLETVFCCNFQGPIKSIEFLSEDLKTIVQILSQTNSRMHTRSTHTLMHAHTYILSHDCKDFFLLRE